MTNASSDAQSVSPERKWKWGWLFLLFPIPALLFAGLYMLAAYKWLDGKSRADWFSDSASSASVLGLFIGIVAFYIAIWIYKSQVVSALNDRKSQTRDLEDAVKKLQNLALSMKKVELGGLMDEFRDITTAINSHDITHALVVSRYSALPAFWYDNELCIDIQVLLGKIDKLVLVGPTDAALASYANEIARVALGVIPGGTNEIKRAVLDRWPGTTVDEVIAHMRNEYSLRHDLSAANPHTACPPVRSELVAELGVNVIILKRSRPNQYMSRFEVFFFADADFFTDADQVQQSWPAVMRSPDVYCASVEIMAKLWKYEFRAIAKSNKEMGRFLDEFGM